MDRLDVKILGGGQNWIALGGQIALGLDGYYSTLPKGSTVSVTTFDPGLSCLEGPKLVAQGVYHMGITTPSWFVRLAAEGMDPYTEKLPLQMLARFPHDDRMAFAVQRKTGLRSLHDLREKRYPLKVSTVPPQNWHPSVWAAEVVLGEYGITFDDIESWGGKMLSDRPRFINAPDVMAATPGFDAVFDEALMTRRWRKLTDDNDLVFLPVDDEIMKRLEERGWERGTIAKGRFRGVEEDVPAVDFSDWILYCGADIDEELAYLTIAGIDEQKEAIQALFPEPFAPMTGKAELSYLGSNPVIPLHPGAERYYREKGCI